MKFRFRLYVKQVILALIFSERLKTRDRLISAELSAFIDRFRSNYISCDLVRIGGQGDGGYLVPNVLEGIKYCFSPGVGPVANFENELSNTYGMTCFLADASVKSTPLVNKNFHFIQKFLGNKTDGEFITLSDWVDQSIGNSDAPKMLQMDIESAEYDVLTLESVEAIASFSVVIVEFHHMDNVFDRYFLRMVSAIFEKFYRNFKIAHAHANNCARTVHNGKVGVPPVIEVTFVRNDLVAACLRPEKISLPHRLDQRNVTAKPDVVMPEIWWKA